MVEPCIFDIARSPPTIRALECTLRWILYFWREKVVAQKGSILSTAILATQEPDREQSAGDLHWAAWETPPLPSGGRDRDNHFLQYMIIYFLQITPPLPYWSYNKGENQKSKIQIQRSKYRCETRQLGSWFRIWLLQPPDFWLVDLHNLKSWCMTQK